VCHMANTCPKVLDNAHINSYSNKMTNKELIEWLNKNIRTSFLPQVWGEKDDEYLRTIVARLEDLERLKPHKY